MTNRFQRAFLISTVAAALCAPLGFAGTAFAAIPGASAPAQNVRQLERQIRGAVEQARAKFTKGETESERQAALTVAIQNAIAASGYDAVTANAALQAFTSGTGAEALAAQSVQSTVAAAAAQEVAAANSTGTGSSGSGSGSGGGAVGGSSGGGGGGGGYITGH